MLIGIPVVLDESSPLFTGILRKAPTVPKFYIRHLPVTTEVAHKVGVEFAGYPKFLAEITFEREGGRHILTLSAREGVLHSAFRSRIKPITVREGHMLRCEFIVRERHWVDGRDSASVHLELGDHAFAQEVREWKLGKMLAYQYATQHQAILTPVVESFAV